MRIGVRAGAGLQVAIIRNTPDYFLDLATAPLFAVIFLALVRNADREDLAVHAVLAPALIALWRSSLNLAGEVIDTDRQLGILEPLIATPARLTSVVLGRVASVTLMGVVALVESWLVASLLFGVELTLFHPWLFVVTLLATLGAMSGTATVMAGLFVLTRTARTFQNSLSYPFFVLGGVIVPVSLLPDWLQPLSKLVFLSWSADLLRASFRPESVAGAVGRLTFIALLGLLGFVVGGAVVRRIIDRVRWTGTVSLT
jgi:ABC-2 type transport system permease protein